METKQAILPLSAPVSISMLLCFGNRHNHITVCDETYFYFIDDIVPASYASGYPFCQKRLVGALPNPLLIAEVPSAAARFANAFPALAVYLMYGPGPNLYERQKEKSRV